ncbi:thiol reductant ABC exporter subunit CydD [Lampropedia aestuarii]|uniref:thiol reductant ABC exporter subunit CydD n=1 Tax=Lampropedia aestuarii TaxID=2562762 RepID=UPI00246866DD|nr:thiol reductant ABC exporter subunit CydD [Lampropedia aestuarii]MDH5857163.1 thiol reductant ABC exporter subunit CydD [Lampropedia aestuarii]
MKSQRTQSPRHSRHWSYTLQGVASLLWIGQAWCIASVVARLMATQNPELVTSPAIDMVWVLQWVAAIALLGAARAALEYFGTQRSYVFARGVLSQLRGQFGQQLRQSSPLDARRPTSGEITSVWMEQAEAIVPWLARYQAAQWRVVIAAPVIAIVVAWHSWIAALLLLMAAPLIPLFMAIIGWRAQAVSEEQMQSLGSLHGQLLERLRALPTLRAMHAVDATAQRLSNQGKEVAGKTMKVLRIAMLSSAVLELFSALGVALVAVYIGFHLLGELPFGSWGTPLTLQSGLFILLLAPSFFEPLRELSAVWHDKANGQAAMQRMRHLLGGLASLPQTQPLEMQGDHSLADAVSLNTAPSISLVQASPRLHQLRDTQPNTPPHATAVAPVDVFIPAGAHVAITGPSGCGKSMLLAMVAGLIDLDSGHVVIDQHHMNDANASKLRQGMAWMGQNPQFFTGSLAKNLHLGRSHTHQGASDQAVLASVGLADVATEHQGLRLGEGGSGISGGEALRLALARLAVNTEAQLLLLDEPTAHLDSGTAQQVIRTIVQIARHKTLLVVTHDPDMVAAMPYVLQLDGHGGATWLVHPEEVLV